MSSYSFLPYIRQGLSDLITNPDVYDNSFTDPRVSFSLSFPVTGNKVGGGTDTNTVAQTINLKGPGDIIGINNDEIIKVGPVTGTTNFEPNYLPFIEFYDEDFPWRYTPAKATIDTSTMNKYRLRPWISLVVLTEAEFTVPTFNGILPCIETKVAANQIFPSELQTWAWAHVHVNDDLGINSDPTAPGVGYLKTLLNGTPDKVISRLLCPRRLQPNTTYYAFVIPTFEAGRVAGANTGQDPATIPALQTSWSSSDTGGKVFPVYYQWSFKTGASGDFESLVRLLVPRVVGNNVGKRAIDLQYPDAALQGRSPVPTIGLQGVLHPTSQTADSWIPTLSDTGDFTSTLAGIVNKSAMSASGDPIVAPPIYGRWAAAVSQVSTNPADVNSNWLHTLNLDPRYRTFAGIGAEVVRHNQDKYMSIAWQQVGSIIEANRNILQMQAAMRASEALHGKHIASISNEMQLNISGPVHAKVLMESGLGTGTVYSNIVNSAITETVFSGAFRRITSPNTVLMQSLALDGSPVTTQQLISDLNTSNAVMAPAYTAPVGMQPYNIWPANQLTPTYTASLPPLSNFSITVPGTPLPSFTVGSPNQASAIFSYSVQQLHTSLSSIPPYIYNPLPPVTIPNVAQSITTGIDPRTTILKFAQSQITASTPVHNTPTTITALDLVLAAPQINLFMYEDLAALSTEWLMPGLNGIPDNSINLLEMDQTYIEAFMVGVNHEMSRLLLWRGYPTDQRGTCFSFFWGYDNILAAATDDIMSDPNYLGEFKDIYPIHTWRLPNASAGLIVGPLDTLGTNNPRPGFSSSIGVLVLTIRGELLRRFPGTIISMQQAQWQPKTNPSGPQDYDYTKPRQPDPNGPVLYPVFKASLDPDIYFIGFEIDVATAKGVIGQPDKPGYFFVFQERAGEMKFGAEEVVAGATYSSQVSQPGPTVAATWNDLNWGNVYSQSPSTPPQFMDMNYIISLPNSPHGYNPDIVDWGTNAADMAYILQRLPIKLDVHANSLLQ